MGFRRGEIVWARVQFPAKWWPAVVQSAHGHRVAVSFFDDAGKSRYFLETEVCSFEENFDSLVKTIKNSSRGGKLLEFALALIARRAAYDLKCRCHFRPLLAGGGARRSKRIADSFRPDKLLNFVSGLAVSPVVGDSDFAGAVTLAAQVNVFRRYMVVEQKLLHQIATEQKAAEEEEEARILAEEEKHRKEKELQLLEDQFKAKEEARLAAEKAEQVKLASVPTNVVMVEEEEESDDNRQTMSQLINELSVKNVGQDRIEGTFTSKESCCQDSTEAEEPMNAFPVMNNMDRCRDSDNISVKAIGRKRVDPKNTSKESPTKKSKVDKQSARAIYGSCQNLYMKFPQDFKLPSKMDLIKKFCKFGQIDLVRTKVFERLGSAQVVFMHPFDAATAYYYAKFKRNLFFGALVLYWLDRFEQKRNHSRFSAPLPALKPCLKSPFLCGKEDKKPSRKVRFSMPT